MVSGYIPPGESKKKLVHESRRHLWDAPYLYRVCADGLLRRCVPTPEGQKIIEKCHAAHMEVTMVYFALKQKSGRAVSIGHLCMKIQRTSSADVQTARGMEGSQLAIQCP